MDKKNRVIIRRSSKPRAARPPGGGCREDDAIEALVQEELDAALGAARSARVGAMRQGYRQGTRDRTLTTSLGADPDRDAAGAGAWNRGDEPRVAQ